MHTYYNKKRAASYDRTWHVFTEATLGEVVQAINIQWLQEISRTYKRPPRILDAACGTGTLLQQIGKRLPEAELYGLDASPEMLEQARQHVPHAHLHTASLGSTEMASLPYQRAFFDLITCTNAFHYLDNPSAVTKGVSELLTPEGRCIIEDYARRSFPFPWPAFEWLIRRSDPQHIRAYTLREAIGRVQAGCLHVTTVKSFSIDLIWQGWLLVAERQAGEQVIE